VELIWVVKGVLGGILDVGLLGFVGTLVLKIGDAVEGLGLGGVGVRDWALVGRVVGVLEL